MQTSVSETNVVSDAAPVNTPPGMVDRRQRQQPAPHGQERRQFASTYGDLSPDARELALAIDSYKAEHRRRYLTFEEMLAVIKRLGYHKDA